MQCYQMLQMCAVDAMLLDVASLSFAAAARSSPVARGAAAAGPDLACMLAEGRVDATI